MDKEQVNRLVERIGSGDDAAFTQLYNGLKGPLYSFLFPLLKNESDILDVMQDTFKTVIIKSRDRYFSKNCFGCIFTIAKNRALDLIKKKKREPPAEPDILSRSVSTVTDENKLVSAIDTRRALNSLPNFEQQILYLHYGEKYTIPELAAIFGKGTTTIKRHLIAAKEKLKKMLEE